MRALVLASALFFLVGCGGATPLLHPAHVLAPGEIRAEAGIAARAVVGNMGDALKSAGNEAANAKALGQDPCATGCSTTYAEGALVAAAMAPDLSPVAGARVGVGAEFEGGIMYTGRGARIDLRRAFALGKRPTAWALSIGLGVDFAFEGRNSNNGLPDVDNANLFGVGGDLPVLLGWKSSANLYYVWLGARFGYEHDTIQPRNSETVPPDGQSTAPQLAGDRFAVGGLLGLAIGFRHIHVALELEADYALVTGSFGGTSAKVEGLSLTPATALWLDF
jgi:hypothetical protein